MVAPDAIKRAKHHAGNVEGKASSAVLPVQRLAKCHVSPAQGRDRRAEKDKFEAHGDAPFVRGREHSNTFPRIIRAVDRKREPALSARDPAEKALLKRKHSTSRVSRAMQVVRCRARFAEADGLWPARTVQVAELDNAGAVREVRSLSHIWKCGGPLKRRLCRPTLLARRLLTCFQSRFNHPSQLGTSSF